MLHHLTRMIAGSKDGVKEGKKSKKRGSDKFDSMTDQNTIDIKGETLKIANIKQAKRINK